MFPSSLGFGPPGPQRFEWINHNGKRLEIDLNFFNASAAVSSSTAATARIGSP